MLSKLGEAQIDLTSEARNQLLTSVTDLFLLDPNPSATSKEHFGEIAVDTVAELKDEYRRAFSERVAAVPVLPHKVAMALGGDVNPEVARAVLMMSPVLTDADLAAFALSQSQQHLAAIADRAVLSEQITSVLVSRGDEVVLQRVSGNEGARFSDPGFNELLARGGEDPAVATNLALRSDMSSERMDRVLKVVQVLTEGGKAGPFATQAMQQRLEIGMLLQDLAAGKRKIDDVVTMLAQEGRAYHLSQAIAQGSKVGVEKILRALMQRDAAGIGVACKAVDLSPVAFREVALFRERRLRVTAKTVDEDAAAYAKLTRESAESAMFALRRRT